jgi:hypothetical protein
MRRLRRCGAEENLRPPPADAIILVDGATEHCAFGFAQ